MGALRALLSSPPATCERAHRRKCQTITATPAKPGDLLRTLGLYAFELKTKHLPFVLIFAGFSLSLLGVAFSVTWLNGFVSESRHLLIFPLLMIPIFVSYLLSSRTPVARVAALFVLMAPLGRTLIPDASIASDDLVPIRASISPIPGFGKTATINGRVLVGPIPWEEPQGGYSPTGAPRWGASQAGAFHAR